MDVLVMSWEERKEGKVDCSYCNENVNFTQRTEAIHVSGKSKNTRKMHL